jgi:hypothetical protein
LNVLSLALKYHISLMIHYHQCNNMRIRKIREITCEARELKHLTFSRISKSDCKRIFNFDWPWIWSARLSFITLIFHFTYLCVWLIIFSMILYYSLLFLKTSIHCLKAGVSDSWIRMLSFIKFLIIKFLIIKLQTQKSNK